jgi:hypothetical protein
MPKTRVKATDMRPEPPGPKPDVLKIHGNWKDAIKQPLTKQKPPEGWPK